MPKKSEASSLTSESESDDSGDSGTTSSGSSMSSSSELSDASTSSDFSSTSSVISSSSGSPIGAGGRSTKRRPSDEIVNDAPGGYTSNFGLIDTHYYTGKKTRPSLDKGGPSVSRAEEKEHAQTLREARSKVVATNMTTTLKNKEDEGKEGRSIYVVRNGERLDRVFPEWLDLAFSAEGKYRPYDLNQPLTMPKRPGGKEEFRDDGPITEIGYVTSQMIGRALRLSKLHFSAIYCSPGLRCIQTANGVLKTLGSEHGIRVEPGLFEYTGWYKHLGIPKWLTPAEMKKAGYRVELDYKPMFSHSDIKKGESARDHHDRISKLVKMMLERDSGDVLIVGHGTTMDGVARPLLGHRISEMTTKQMDRLGSQYPYSSVIALRQRGSSWKIIQDALPPASYLGFTNRLKTDLLQKQHR